MKYLKGYKIFESKDGLKDLWMFNIKGKINILPSDDDNISYIYLTFIRDGVYKGKVFV